MDGAKFERTKQKAKRAYKKEREILCPFFERKIQLNSDGFHHLQYSSGKERNKKEQLLKFRLLPRALQIIKKSGTLQEYRRTMAIAHKGRYSNKKSSPMKTIEYWAFIAIVSEPKIRVRVILRRMGNGQITFWSVMPDVKLGGADQYTRLYRTDLGDE